MVGKASVKKMEVNRFSHEWVETPAGLERVARILDRAEIIGVDLEADSMYHYFEKVCLLQVATEGASYVIDPLAVRDLSALRPVFSSPRIRKVFHGADYDIRSLYRDFQIEIENLFDTQLACKFLGLRQTGLEALLRSRFHVALNKKFQRADWSRRPLSPQMVEYAAMDGMYLIPLAKMLEKELEEKGRLSWVEEECRSLCKARFAPPYHQPLYLRVKGALHLDRRTLSILEALLRFREAQARKVDLPPFKVIGNESLLELARQKPLTLEELETRKILSRKQMDRHAKRLLQEIHGAMTIPDQELAVYTPEPEPALAFPLRRRVKALKTWREDRAKHLQMDPGDLLNNSLINGLAMRNPRSTKEMDEVPGLRKWQKDHFSREILSALTQGTRRDLEH